MRLLALLMGAAMTGRYYFGGEFPKVDFVFTQNACDTNGKCQLLLAEQLGANYVMVDIPVVGNYKQTRRPYYVDYVAAQFNEAIEKIKRISGRPHDDEKLIEAIYNRCTVEVLWAEIMALNQAIPSPMDMKSQYTFLVPLLVAKYKPETVEFYRALKQEMEERVKQGIAAVPTERCRLLHHGAPPWHSLRFFRVPQAYGAVFIGSDFSIVQFAAFEEKPDGKFGPSRDPREAGVVLRNREEALRFFAEWYLERAAFTWCGAQTRIDHQLHLVKEWRVDGVVYHVDRGCENNTSGVLESKMGVSQALGVPTIVYEGNRGDTRDWSEIESIDRLESFLESMGLKKLEE
ncbi:MAG: 2-hydroxyacyl-CoA dehydratase [Chloroflexi bacterium]|nr:2-hydroxyacyl-CoA dehydratase [Chloroflexota bacterium]